MYCEICKKEIERSRLMEEAGYELIVHFQKHELDYLAGLAKVINENMSVISKQLVMLTDIVKDKNKKE